MDNTPEIENDEMYLHHKLIVDKGQESIRIDKYIMNLIENTTRNKIQNSIKAENVIVNDKVIKSNYKVKPYDIISILMTYPPRDTTIIAEDIPLNIIYEDNDLLIVNKNSGMVVHPGHGNYNKTLLNALAFHLAKNPSFDSGFDSRLGLVHRIDKDTSGLLVIAKNELSMNYLAKQFYNKTTQRIYNALVWGNVEKDQDSLYGYISRNPKDRMQMSIFENEEEGKNVITHYRVLERFRYTTLIECQLETGRTHQIRAHMKSIGHPLFNDARYGGDKILKGNTSTKYKQFIDNCFKILSRQALHAKTLGFIHPSIKKNMFFETELPKDMKEVLEKWRNFINFNPNL